VSKRRLTDSQAHPVNRPADGCIDLALHLFCKPLVAGCGSSGEVGNLADFSFLWMPKAEAPELAGNTGRFGAFELDGLEIFNGNIEAAAIESFSGRTDTMTEVFGKYKVLGCKELP
jgi:hypothetical protein